VVEVVALKMLLLVALAVLAVVVVLELTHQNQVAREIHLPHHLHKEIMVDLDSQDQMLAEAEEVVELVLLEETDHQLLAEMVVLELHLLFQEHQ
jgi:hypothetical protein